MFYSSKEEFSILEMGRDTFALYAIWAFFYVLKIFVFSAKKIKERNYGTTYVYLFAMPFFQPMVQAVGQNNIPIFFMSLHLLYSIITILVAYICFINFYFHTLWVTGLLLWSVWNGASYYMDFFAKKYESSLRHLEELEKEIEKKD